MRSIFAAATIIRSFPGIDQFTGLRQGKFVRPRHPKSIPELGSEIKFETIGDGVDRPGLSGGRAIGGRTTWSVAVAGGECRGRDASKQLLIQ